MSKKSENNFGPSEFANCLYGKDFEGAVVLWNGGSKGNLKYEATDTPALTRQTIKQSKTADVYYGLATQDPNLPLGSRGKSGTAVSVAGCFLDVDFKSDDKTNKQYVPDQATAMKILEELKWLLTLVIQTGGGLHVYTLFDKPFIICNEKDRERIKKVSKAFGRKAKEAFKKHGYDIDTVSDIARVVRIPGTLNHKYDPPRPVEMVEYKPENRVDFDEIAAELEKSPAKSRPKKQRSYPPADHEAIREACPWYADQTGEGAATSTEPDWFAACSITGCCEDAEKIVLDYSKSYPGFKEREAIQKIRRAVKAAAPFTCNSICEDLGHDEFCLDCTHWGKIKSPVQLGRSFGYDPGKIGPIPLGYTKYESYALLDQQRKILIQASSSQLFSYQYQLGLSDSVFWGRQYPSSKSAFNSMAVGEALIAACKAKGPFDPLRVRGRGVWREGDQIVVNLGDPVQPGLSHTYLCFDHLKIDAGVQFDTARLLKLIGSFPWRRKGDAILTLGWLAWAPICGVLNWRPHGFIYGPPKTGKTSLHNLKRKLLYPLCISADGQSTEAGIRQQLGPDSLPVVIDEFEADQRQYRLSSIIRLARSASSAESPVLRGTPEGKAMQFSIRTMMMFSAVTIKGMSPADETRIIALELVPHDGNTEVGEFIEKECDHFGSLGPQWCGHMASKVLELVQSLVVFKAAMSGLDDRHRKNMATLLAGAFVALHGRIPTDDEARQWFNEQQENIELHGLSHERDSAKEALDHLFYYNVQSNRLEMTMGQWIARRYQELQKNKNGISIGAQVLAEYDIRLELSGPKQGLLIRNGAPGINRVFEGTQWENNAWKRALLQIDGAYTPTTTVQFPNTKNSRRCISLPLEIIPDLLYDGDDDEEF